MATVPNGATISGSEMAQDYAIDEFVSTARSECTQRAYRTSIKHFLNWGGRLPCYTQELLIYLLEHQKSHSSRTLRLRTWVIGQWHRWQNLDDPTEAADVNKVLSAIERIYGKPTRIARALPVEDLEVIVKMLRQRGDLTAMRDSALIQIGFFGGLQRRQLVQLQVGDLSWETDGLRLKLACSTSDVISEKVIPFGDSLYLCPVTALRNWLDAAGITSGPVFRRLGMNNVLGDKGFYTGTVNTIIAARAAEAGINGRITSQSLRSGLAISSHRQGSSVRATNKLCGWKDTSGRLYYYLAFVGQQVSQNAALTLLQAIEKSHSL